MDRMISTNPRSLDGPRTIRGTIITLMIILAEKGFCMDALRSVSDRLIFQELRFDWLREQPS